VRFTTTPIVAIQPSRTNTESVRETRRGIGRNSLTEGNNISIDLRWSHDWKLTKAKDDHAKIFTFGVDSFNLLNHPNFNNPSANISAPGSLGVISSTKAYAGPRNIMLRGRLEF
jgi:hypothetical protein